MWPDEVFQVLEQAHRLVFGAGMIPWEYEYGIRSWTAPLAIAAILKPLQLVGLDSPRVYQPVVEAVLCAFSLLLPFSVYRISQRLFDEGTARVALIFTAFWYELVSYGHRTTIDALAAYTAFGAMALLLAPRRRVLIAACGAVAGLTIVLRFQLLPMVSVMGLVALWRWRLDAWVWVVAWLAVVVAGGALDYYTWGAWFSSVVIYARLNFTYDVASLFGTDPFYWYVPVLMVLSGGLALAGAIGLMFTWRRSWLLIAVGATTLAAYSAVAHKEPRFVFPLIPIWLIGLAVLVSNRGELLAQTVPHARRLAPWVSRGMIAAFCAISVLGLLNRLPLENRVSSPNIARNDARAAYRELADLNDVAAVVDLLEQDESNPWNLAPYYDLHHDVPIYWPLAVSGFGTAKADPKRYASHVLVRTASPGPEGFRPLKTIGTVTIWRRRTDPPSTLPPPEYTNLMGGHPVPTAPIVNPRW
jgi:hypothetical protein